MSTAVLLGLGLHSCGPDEAGEPQTGRTVRAITDTDGDGMDDGWETTHFGDLNETGTGDFDSDGMSNLDEYTYDFDPTVHDAFEDEDGDRYPNVFELEGSADPTDANDIPAADYIIDPPNAGVSSTDNIYDDIKDGIDGANAANAYQIILIKEGTYTGARNTALSVSTAPWPLLILGDAGAAKTVIDGEGIRTGWSIYSEVVIASLSFRNHLGFRGAFYFQDSDGEHRLVDLFVSNNATNGGTAGAIHCLLSARLFVLGSTFLENTSATGVAQQLYVHQHTNLVLTNTAVYGSGTLDMFKALGTVTVSASYSFIKGETLTGTGNLEGTTDPLLNPQGRASYLSPLISAGIGGQAFSHFDFDLEDRPSSSPDIGVDQFIDTDSDNLADSWEVAETGGLTQLTSTTQDSDSDGLDNLEEHDQGTQPTDSDTDNDGVSDGDEVNTHGSDPLSTDTDEDGMPDGWEVTHGLDLLADDRFDDEDGDRYPNIFEFAKGSSGSSDASTPTPDQWLDPPNAATVGDNIHDDLEDAISAANSANDFQIIAIKPGTYTGDRNTDQTVNLGAHPLLIIGESGAGTTVFDGEHTSLGWQLLSEVVVASVTLKRFEDRTLYVNDVDGELRFIDLFIQDNHATAQAGGLHVYSASRAVVSGTTFLGNTGSTSYGDQIWCGSKKLTIENSVAWGASSGDSLIVNPACTLSTTHSLIKGETLAGTGNLSGTTDPAYLGDCEHLSRLVVIT